MENKSNFQGGYQQPPAPGFIPPPPYSMQPQPGQQHQPNAPGVVIIHHTPLGPETQRMTCPHCRADISTRVENESNSKTHLFAILLCVLGCWCCVCCPYCIDSCLVKKHYCPSCDSYLGQYEN